MFSCCFFTLRGTGVPSPSSLLSARKNYGRELGLLGSWELMAL